MERAGPGPCALCGDPTPVEITVWRENGSRRAGRVCTACFRAIVHWLTVEVPKTP